MSIGIVNLNSCIRNLIKSLYFTSQKLVEIKQGNAVEKHDICSFFWIHVFFCKSVDVSTILTHNHKSIL